MFDVNEILAINKPVTGKYRNEYVFIYSAKDKEKSVKPERHRPKQQAIDKRRADVDKLMKQNIKLIDISKILDIPYSRVTADAKWLKENQPSKDSN